MEASTTTTAVEREITIDASPETVWQFLVDPDKMERWLGSEITIDPRPGGDYRVDVMANNNLAKGEYLEVDPPHRLVHTFGWETSRNPEMAKLVPPGSTRLEFELEPTDGGTKLTFRHVGLPTDEAIRNHGIGWDHYLERLRVLAAGGDPGPDVGPQMPYEDGE
jgi:uncharacterized protein YndB with AHSA1/START domain